MSVQTLWVAENPNTEMVAKPIIDRLSDLHNALRANHAGLWVNHKPNEPRYLSKEMEIGGRPITVYAVVYNQRVLRETIRNIAEGYGFTVAEISYPQLVPTLVQ